MGHSLVHVYAVLGQLPAVAAFNTLHFREWFSEFHSTFMSNGTTYMLNGTSPCQDVISTYWSNTNNFNCFMATSCLLNNIGELATASIGSASVVLGILPTVLAGFGPTVAEMSLLSSQRPFLSFLLALGAPSVYPNRLLDYTHPVSTLEQLPANLSVGCPEQCAIYISMAQYLLAICAIVNNFNASLKLGISGVLSWSCNGWPYPLAWSLIPILVHVSGAVAIYQMTHSSNKKNHSTNEVETRFAPRKKWWQPKSTRAVRLLAAELQLCVNRPAPFQTHPDQFPRNTYFGVFCASVLANMLSVGHLIFGTLVLSSMLFVSEWDAVQLVARYALSAMACRVILLYELAGMRKSRKQVLEGLRTGVALRDNIQNQLGKPASSSVGLLQDAQAISRT